MRPFRSAYGPERAVMADTSTILACVPAKAGTYHLAVHHGAVPGAGFRPAQGRGGFLIEGQING